MDLISFSYPQNENNDITRNWATGASGSLSKLSKEVCCILLIYLLLFRLYILYIIILNDKSNIEMVVKGVANNIN